MIVQIVKVSTKNPSIIVLPGGSPQRTRDCADGRSILKSLSRLSDATDAELRYKAWLNTAHADDKVCPLASINGDNFYGSCLYGDSSGWIDQVMDLTDVYTLGDLTGQPNVWVALYFTSDSSNNNPEGVYVDDILLQKCTSGGCSGSSPDLPGSNNTRIFNLPAVKSLDFP